MDERWQRILRIMDEAFEEYLTGMAALRGRVVTDLKRKVSDSQVLDPPPSGTVVSTGAAGFEGEAWRARGRRPRG